MGLSQLIDRGHDTKDGNTCVDRKVPNVVKKDGSGLYQSPKKGRTGHSSVGVTVLSTLK